jgi:DNA invertase Pin-like site-specific DNA recombinase
MKRAIELIRVSTEGQAASDRASIPAQRAANRRTARAYGLEIVRSIEMADVSGAAVLLAPEMQELLSLIADPTIHGVVAREFSDYALLQAFADTRTVLYLPEGPIDFASKTGRLMGTIRAAIAGMERTEILERIWAAKEEKRRAGGFAQNRICLPRGVGYTEGAGWHYTPDAERVREAFRLLLSGETSLSVLARVLGVTIAGARGLLRNPIYAGWRVIDSRRDPSSSAVRPKRGGRQGDRRKMRRAPEDVIRVRVIEEPLVTEAEFARAQALLEAVSAMNRRRRPKGEGRYTYRGFLRCAVCGSVVYTHGRGADYYVCKLRRLAREGEGCASRWARRDVLDPKLDSLFAERLNDEGFLSAIAAEVAAESSRGADATRFERLEEQEARLASRRSRVLDMFVDGAIDRAERDARLAGIDAARAAVSSALSQKRPAEGLSVGRLLEAFAPFREFEYLQLPDKRRLLSALAPEISVAGYSVLGLSVALPRGDDFSRTGRGSWPSPA